MINPTTIRQCYGLSCQRAVPGGHRGRQALALGRGDAQGRLHESDVDRSRFSGSATSNNCWLATHPGYRGAPTALLFHGAIR